MNYEFGILSWWLFVSAMVSLLIAVYSWKKRILSNSFYLSLLSFATAEWALAGVYEAAVTTVPMKILWSQISYLGIVFTPLFYLLFALSYSHQDHLLTKRNIILASIIPYITLIVAMTNNLHQLLWLDVSITESQNIGLYEHGSWFYVNMGYSYLLIMVGLINILKTQKKLSPSLGGQVRIIIFGAAIPLLANVIYVFGLNPIPGLDWTPVAFGISGLLFALGVFRYGMLSIIPVARDFLVETMNEEMLVLDIQDYVVDINPAMSETIGLPDAKIIGREISAVLKGWPDLLTILTENDEYHTTLKIEDHYKSTQYRDIQVTWITHLGVNHSGRMVICRNVTELETTRAALRRCEDKTR